MMTGNSIIAFHHVAMITFYVITFKKFSLLRRTFNMTIFKTRIWWMRTRTWRIQRTRRIRQIRRFQRIWRIHILIRI